LWERMGHSRSERELAADFVHDVVSSFLFGLDIHLAGLDADLVGQAVIGLGTVHQVGDVVLLAAVLNVDFRCQRRTARCAVLPVLAVVLAALSALAVLRAVFSTAGASAAVETTVFFSDMDSTFFLKNLCAVHSAG